MMIPSMVSSRSQPIVQQRTQRHLQRFAEDRHSGLGLPCGFGKLAIALGLRFLLRLVGSDTPVGDADDAVRVSGDVAVVGHHNDRVPLPVQLLQDGHDLFAALAVERAGRFIGQDDRPAVHQRARDADALLLAAGELVRLVLQPVAQSELAQQVTGVRRTLRLRHATVDCRNFGVFDGVEIATSGCSAGR